MSDDRTLPGRPRDRYVIRTFIDGTAAYLAHGGIHLPESDWWTHLDNATKYGTQREADAAVHFLQTHRNLTRRADVVTLQAANGWRVAEDIEDGEL